MTPTTLLALTEGELFQVVFAVGAAVLFIPLGWWVHLGLRRCFVAYARRHCARRGIEVLDWCCFPELEASGVKTEFSIVEIKGLDADGGQRYLRLQVWIFGVRKVLADEPWPEEGASAPVPAR